MAILKRLDDGSMLKIHRFNKFENFEIVQKLILDQINYPNDNYVEIYEYNILDKNINQYSYRMEYLEPLSKDEKAIVLTLQNYLYRDDFASCYRQAKSFSNNQLFEFIMNARIVEKYVDLHSNNIRKTIYNKYKLIDLEGKIGL